jgi:Spy/CpxP family protein refolding chaperone
MIRRSRGLALVAAALVAGAAGTAAAQSPAGGPPGGPPGGRPGGMGRGGQQQAMLFEGITLTDAQRAAVDSIQGARRAAMRERMMGMQGGGAPGGGVPDSAAVATMRQEMRRAQEQDRAAMRALLTADQQKAFDANVARMQDRQRQRMQNGGPGGGAPGGGPGGTGAGPNRPAGDRS